MLKHKPQTALALAQRFLEPGDSVLEIGAADGEYTRGYADRVGPTGEVLAVEPDARSRALLQQTVADQPWVTVCASAVGVAVGTALFYPDRRRPKLSSVYQRNVDRPGTATLVPVITLDLLVQGMRQSPAVIQVDAQGAEVEILRGAVRTLRLPIVWIVEIWPAGLHAAGASSADLLRVFQAAGYGLETAAGASLSWASAHRECVRVSAAEGGHCDLVMVPQALRAEVSA